MKKTLLSILVVAVVAIGMSPAAHADGIYNLTVANPDLFSQGTGPYALVTIAAVDLTGTEWSVTALGLNDFVFGAKGAMALNVNLDYTGSVTLTSCSMLPCTQAAAGNNDGFGSYTLKVNDGPGFSIGGYTSMTFQFTTEKSVSLSNLLIANEHGASVSAHMALASNTGCTGYAADAGRNDASGPTQSAPCVSTPEPNSLSTAGIGVIGLLLLLVSGRRFAINR